MTLNHHELVFSEFETEFSESPASIVRASGRTPAFLTQRRSRLRGFRLHEPANLTQQLAPI